MQSINVVRFSLQLINFKKLVSKLGWNFLRGLTFADRPQICEIWSLRKFIPLKYQIFIAIVKKTRHFIGWKRSRSA